MKAIIYTSNTGSTSRYAKMLAHEITLPVYSAEEARKTLPAGSEIIYLGWLMAGSIKGYEKTARRYQVCAVCGVGMGQTGSQMKEVRERNKIPDSIPLFTLQGDFDITKLRGIYKMMMNIMIKTAGKALAEKAERTPEEDDMLKMMQGDGERVHINHLKGVLEWYRTDYLQNAGRKVL